MRREKNNFSLKEIIFLIVITCIVSLIIGYSLASKKQKTQQYDKDLKTFIDNYNYILEKYYDGVNKEKLIYGAIDGMVSALGDDYSKTIDDEDYFDVMLDGSYYGVGVQIVTTSDKKMIIYNVIEDSPAYNSGIKKMDEIISIDDKTFESGKELSNYIRNSKNTSFKIKVLRKNEQIEIEVKRALVTLESVNNKIIEHNNKKIGYIIINIFASNTVSQFKNALNSLEQDEIDGLVIDVRNNTGGHLSAVTEILSSLLGSDKVIYQTQIKDNITKKYSSGKQDKTYPIVVIQNKNSASASELLSSALQEQYNATIIGETSYGKGTVQELVKLSNGKEYKFTTKKWLTSKGKWIEEKGVAPDIEVLNENDEIDSQLEKALEVLTRD